MEIDRMVVNHKFIDVVHKCSLRKFPLEGVYRRIQDRELFLTAYGNLYANRGALTAGSDPVDTVDGMSIARIDAMLAQLRAGTFKWTPVRRTYIPKGKRKKGYRPLGVPNWSDKLLQEVIRMVLEAYYEPRFSPHSHGFRPGRGCHTALQDIYYGWTGTKWYIEGDIRGCFDNINHEILLNILSRDIKDNRFLKLIRKMLRAGYIEDWRRHATYSGTPQGGICSPILSNILLHELDRYVEEELIPAYNRGQQRRKNPEYVKIRQRRRRARNRGDWEEAETLLKALREATASDPNDPNYRRLRYCRYADDWILGFAGPNREAQDIKQKLSRFLATIGLEMSAEKTLITHALTGRARFLNYDITTSISRARPHVNYKVKLLVPREVRLAWMKKFTRDGEPHQRPELLELTDFEIVQTYGREFQGIVNYYCLAENVSGVFYPIKHLAITSAVKTIACKRKSSAAKVHRQYYQISEHNVKALIVEQPNPNNPDKPFQAKLGEKPIKRQRMTVIKDQIDSWSPAFNRTELTQRLVAQKCELCGSVHDIQVHHVRKLADLKRRYRGRSEPPIWVQCMIARRRKTLVVCTSCHRAIHAGTYDGQRVN
jgi:group II intron reverse transcriptase/maturase